MVWLGLLGAAMAADAIAFSATTAVPEGGTPELRFEARVHGNLRVDVSCSGKRFELQTATVPDHTYPLVLPGLSPGSHACVGTVRLDEPDGSWGEMPLNMQVSLLAPLAFRFEDGDLDLEVGTLVARPSRPLAKANMDRIGIGGVQLGGVAVDLSDPAQPRFTWTPNEEVLKLRVTATDTTGLSGFLELSPWAYAVPHEDVIFASGAHAVEAGEVPKLEQCWTEVERVLAKYGDVVQIQLYVAGYTDTVGAAGPNQQLSERRARAIAAWFRNRGFTGAVHFQGFGEGALAVVTADEVDEAANRRALYVLAAQAPATSSEMPSARWSTLSGNTR